MTLTTCRVLVLALAVAVPSAAQAASEALSASAALSFQATAFGPSAPSFRPHRAGGVAQAARILGVLDSLDEYLRDHIRVVGETAVAVMAPTLVADLDLKVLLNRQLKTSLRFDMGGRTVWCGGVFDLQQNAYLSVLVEGEAARYYNVKGIYKREKTLRIGSKTYKLWLSPNVFDKIKSEIVFTNRDDEYDETRFTLKKMLSSVAEVGAPVPLSGQSYRVFYADGLRGDQPDASARLFTFAMTGPNGDLHVYLIPEALVPSDRIAIFKMFADQPVGLTRQADFLKIYENP
ncbi:MAG: hypothetical protein AAB262_14945 [Elusimicrobiota bacterium]